METTQPGIFVSGAFQRPIDIPESVFAASGAGAQCGELLDYRRGKLTQELTYPSEKDVSAEEPRIGVFVCHCGANIGRVVDVPSTVGYVRALPNVVYAQEQLFSCATNCAKEITDLAKETGLNRVVVAACSPRTLEPLFRDTLREAGINQYFFDMANIREHCSWVHSKEKEDATRKAKDIEILRIAPRHPIDIGLQPLWAQLIIRDDDRIVAALKVRCQIGYAIDNRYRQRKVIYAQRPIPHVDGAEARGPHPDRRAVIGVGCTGSLAVDHDDTAGW